MKCPENWLAELSKYPEFRSGECREEDSYRYLHEKWYEILAIDGTWILDEDLDTIVSWRPVGVSEILKAVIE